MCGIAGIIGRLDERNRAALARMNDAMVHRGPDASGTWASTPDARGWGALLAHRRLAILDLSPAGAQPMVDPVTGHVITFNGEIYNYQDLRRRLIAEGQTFQSSGDTAVMLRALGLHGSVAVSWLRGMFAFACWAPEERRLLLARDPLGIKPLYVARSTDPNSGWSMAFASELRALLASGLLGHAASRSACRGQRLYGTASWLGPVRSSKVSNCSGLVSLMEFDGSGNEVRQRRFLAHPEQRSRAEHETKMTSPRSWKKGCGSILPATCRWRSSSPAESIPRRWPIWRSAPRRARSTPLRWPSKSRNSTRDRPPSASPPRSAPSTTKWC